MAKVRCDLQNASEKISGYQFSPGIGGGMVSEDLPDEAAARFASIPGYVLIDEATEPQVVSEQVATPDHGPTQEDVGSPADDPVATKTQGKRAAKAGATTEEVEK
jgi:hypothetical protein